MSSWSCIRESHQFRRELERWFDLNDYVEIDGPLLMDGGNLDTRMPNLRVETPFGDRWLPSSPEYPLRRALASRELPRVWGRGRCFRPLDRSDKHRPEFSMAEWYQTDEVSLSALNDDAYQLICLAVRATPPRKTVSLIDLLHQKFGMAIENVSDADLINFLGGDQGPETWRREYLVGQAAQRVASAYLADAVGVTHLVRWPDVKAGTLHATDGVVEKSETSLGSIELADGGVWSAQATRRNIRFNSAIITGAFVDPRFDAIIDDIPPNVGAGLGLDRLFMIRLGAVDLGQSNPFAEG